jgi:hypothetical protein
MKRQKPTPTIAKVLATEFQYHLQDQEWSELLLKCAIASNAGVQVADLLDDRLSEAEWRRVAKSAEDMQERLSKGIR